MKKYIAAALMTAAVTVPAFAADTGYYIGANAGFTRASSIGGTDPSKINGGLFSLLGGYQYNKYLAAEAQYAYLGKAEYQSGVFNATGSAVSTTTHSFGLNAVATLPVWDDLALYGKAGLAFNSTSISNFDAGYSGNTRFVPTAGLGAQYNIAPSIGLRMGWDRYDAAFKNAGGDKQKYYKNAWSLGGLYRF
jgi:OmpA-OmpF porin, OOP family